MKDIVSIASEIAKTAHEGQYRMGKEKRPYIVHPALAADLVEKLVTRDKALLAATWLHDVIEDTPLKTIGDFEMAFAAQGCNDKALIQKIYGLVQELSMPDGLEWKRIRSFQVDKIAAMTEGAKVLKMADQVANTFDVILYPPTEWPAQKIRNYFFKAIDICVACSSGAPKLYALFLELYRRRENLSKNDISELVQAFAKGESAGQDAFAGVPGGKAQDVLPLSSGISLLCAGGKALGAEIDIAANEDLADGFREYVEQTGTFARTHPLSKGARRVLSFAAPVDVDFCRGFLEKARLASGG